MQKYKTKKDEKPTTGMVINCQNHLEENEVYSAIIDALSHNVDELKFVVESEGKHHFTTCPITPIFDMLRKASEVMANDFNRAVGVNAN